MTQPIPSEADVACMVHEILRCQMEEDPRGDTISSGIILPTIADHGFSHDYELVVEGPAEELWGRYLRGEIDNPVVYAASLLRDVPQIHG